jgi:protein TonB
VCRILVDEHGAVREARIFRSRLDLEIYENAALAAVRTWRFAPGRKGGRPVRTWINYPVSFQ